MEDFVGLKFRSNINYDNQFKRMGVVPINMPGGQIYTAMERGVIVGFANPVFIRHRGLHEVTKYVIDHPFLTGGAKYIYMNLQTLNSLPNHLKALVNDVGIELEKEAVALAEKMVSEEREKLDAAGMEFIKLVDGEQVSKIASDTNWETIFKKSPELGPKIREMITKK